MDGQDDNYITLSPPPPHKKYIRYKYIVYAKLNFFTYIVDVYYMTNKCKW